MVPPPQPGTRLYLGPLSPGTDRLASRGVSSALVIQCRPGGLTAGGGPAQEGRGTGSGGEEASRGEAMALHVPPWASLTTPLCGGASQGLRQERGTKVGCAGGGSGPQNPLGSRGGPRPRLHDLPLPRGLRAPAAGTRAPAGRVLPAFIALVRFQGCFFNPSVLTSPPISTSATALGT